MTAKNDAPAANAGANQSGAGSQGKTGSGKNSTASIAGLEVISSRDGFRRAGLVWGKDPVRMPIASLSKEQIAMLKNEPLLTVRDVEIKVEAEKADE